MNIIVDYDNKNVAIGQIKQASVTLSQAIKINGGISPNEDDKTYEFFQSIDYLFGSFESLVERIDDLYNKCPSDPSMVSNQEIPF